MMMGTVRNHDLHQLEPKSWGCQGDVGSHSEIRGKKVGTQSRLTYDIVLIHHCVAQDGFSALCVVQHCAQQVCLSKFCQ
jgi:hypothetical protein